MNVRFVVCLVSAIMVGGVSASFWHAHQLRRNAVFLLRRADGHVAEQEYRAAAEGLRRYLELVPTDAEARIRLAETFDRSAGTPDEKVEAVELLFQAMALAPERSDLRRRQAELLLEVGRPDAALKEANHLLRIPQRKDDPSALAVRAIALHTLSQQPTADATLTDAADALQTAIRNNRGGEHHIELAVLLAGVYRDQNEAVYSGDSAAPGPLAQPERDRLADQTMDEMVAANADRFLAHYARYRYREEHDLAGADEDLDRALALEPRESSTVRLAVASRAVQNGSLDEAFDHFRSVVEVAPSDRRGYLGLAQAYVLRSGQSGNEDDLLQAVDTLRRGLTQVGQHDPALNAQLARTLIRMRRLKEADEVLSVLAKMWDDQILRMTAAQRVHLQATVDLLQAEKHLAEGDYGRAESLLRRVLAREETVGGQPQNAHGGNGRPNETARRAYSLLGTVFGALKQWDRAAEALDKATSRAPNSVLLRLAAGRAWEAAGRLDLAIARFQQCAAMPGAGDEARLSLGQAMLRRQLMLPPADRNWQALQDLLAAGRETAGASFSEKLLASRLAAVQGRIAEAVKLLEETERVQPASASDWRTLVLMYHQLHEPQRADRTLERFARLVGNSAQPFLVRAELLASRGQFGRAEEDLLAAVPSLPAADHSAVYSMLARLSWWQGQRDAAWENMTRAVRTDASDLENVRLLCSMALSTGHLEDLEQWEDRLRKLEGPSGTDWRACRAHRLLVQAQDGNDPRLAEAEQLQAEIQALRPNWSGGFRLKGMLAERRGEPREAVNAYQRAIELDRAGAFREWDAARLVQLVYPDGRDQQVEPLVERLPAALASERKGSALAIAQSIAQGHTARAVEDAREAALHRPKDPVAQIWLGYTLQIAGEVEEAEKAFLLATELAPKTPQTWRELLRFYVGTRMVEKAGGVLARLAEEVEIPEPQRSLLLAQGCQMLDDRTAAESHFVRILQSHGDHVEVLLQASSFFSKTDIDRAETQLRRALKLNPEDRRTHRALASLLASRGTEPGFQEACGLLSDGNSGVSEPADRRMLAEILFRLGGSESRHKAAGMLEELAGNAAQASLQDRLTLARIYEVDGRLHDAERQLAALVDRPLASPDHLAAYADFLTRHLDMEATDFARRADQAIQRLAKVESGSLRTVALRARWLNRTGRGDAVESLVRSFLKAHARQTQGAADQAGLLATAAQVCEIGGRRDLAEKHFRQAATLEPRARLALSLFLADQASEEATAEAVGLCIDAARSDPTSRAAVALSTVLTVGNPSHSSAQLAEPVLAEALKKHAQDADLLLAVGSYRQMSGRDDEALGLFRRVLDLSPGNVVAMNNLAYLLAQVGSPAEAAVHIERAIGIAGQEPWLLDTRGLVHLCQQRAAEAVAVLRELADRPTSDPRFAFHLALAYRLAGKAPEARKALEQAWEAGLQLHTLTPQDQAQLAELDAYVATASGPQEGR
ncbi:MAG: tetratricopeptide repeat protein [Pirellulales bacterium]|nr:tetratricopeptide repeat protein [Pirellulales bacterium]